MSKSLQRVEEALRALGLDAQVIRPGACRTAADAAAAVGCEIDQIVKSLIFVDAEGAIHLFLTAGGNQLDLAKAEAVAGQPLARADARLVREKTGFAIGGVAPLGHLTPPRLHADPRLMDFDRVYAAAGTPDHVFGAAPGALLTALNAPLADFTA